MRMLWLVVVASCGTPSPAPDHPKVATTAHASHHADATPAVDREAFAAMTPDQKCEATAPRGTQCIDEILAMQMRQVVNDDGAANQIADGMWKEPRASGDEAARVHRTACSGDRRYADAVFVCWAEPDCTALATCIDKRTR